MIFKRTSSFTSAIEAGVNVRAKWQSNFRQLVSIIFKSASSILLQLAEFSSNVMKNLEKTTIEINQYFVPYNKKQQKS